MEIHSVSQELALMALGLPSLQWPTGDHHTVFLIASSVGHTKEVFEESASGRFPSKLVVLAGLADMIYPNNLFVALTSVQTA